MTATTTSLTRITGFVKNNRTRARLKGFLRRYTVATRGPTIPPRCWVVAFIAITQLVSLVIEVIR
jgi:hypothetical protein